MIHVCYCFSDKTGRYSKFVGTSMLSIFENCQSPPQSTLIHILHDNTLTQDNREKFIYLAGQYNQLLKFYNVEELCADKITEMVNLVPEIAKSRLSVGAFYKFIIPQIIPFEIEKIIYLDGDTIVNLDIQELWQIELGDKILGVIPEEKIGETPKKSQKLCLEGYVKGEDYFNSGVLLMNLNALRLVEDQIMEGVKFRGENPRMRLYDQTVWNYCFSTQTLKLPVKFDRMTYLNRSQEKFIGKKIYHYAAHSLKLNQDDILNRLWMSYFIRTPFFDAETIGRLYSSVKKIRNDLKNSAVNLSSIVSGKTRAFFVEPVKIEAMKKFFVIHEDEIIISAENEDSIQELLDAMKAAKDKCVFFIMTEKFLKKAFSFDLLTKEGFVENKDFLKGWRYLSETYGEKFNSHDLIKAM